MITTTPAMRSAFPVLPTLAAVVVVTFATARSASAQSAPPDRAPAPADPASSQRAADREPSAAELTAAPPPHQASGRLREPDHDEGPVRSAVNALLWTPRQLVDLALWAPDLLAGRVDDYLESRGPNVFGRGGERSHWTGGAMLAWEAPFGPSVGARVGHTLGEHAAMDVTAVAFGRHGYTGRAAAELEPRAGGPLAIELDGEYAHDRETAFAGVGDHELGEGAAVDPFAPGPVPETILDDRALRVKLATPISLGRFRIEPWARYERHQVAPDDPDDFPYATDALFAFDDRYHLGTGRLEAVYDDTAPAHPWIPDGAPSSGWRLRAMVGYTRGEADADGSFQTAHYGASAERLFDLFRGTRVLIVRARIDAVSAGRREIPLLLLPALGGPDQMRAFSRGRFRDRTATAGELAYEWAVGLHARASLFSEVGGVHRGLDDIEADALHLSAGGAFRLAFDGGTGARAVLAGSETGDWSFFLVLGGV